MTLTEFLLARIAEDEANIDGDWAGGDGGLHIISTPMHDRLLAECEAKRSMVAFAVQLEGGEDAEPWFSEELLVRLALPYADHPDYPQATDRA